jgi:hypothetical protein
MPSLDLSFARMPAQVAAVLDVAQATEVRRRDAIIQRRKAEVVAAAAALGESKLETAADDLRRQAQRDDALEHHLVDRRA